MVEYVDAVEDLDEEMGEEELANSKVITLSETMIPNEVHII